MDNQCICKIRNIYRAIGAFELKLEDAFGMNINEVMLLCVLSECESLLSGEIADELNLTRSNASKVIASLEKKGYIRRKACEHDSRCQRFHITRKGTEQMKRINCDSFHVPTNLEGLLGIETI